MTTVSLVLLARLQTVGGGDLFFLSRLCFYFYCSVPLPYNYHSLQQTHLFDGHCQFYKLALALTTSIYIIVMKLLKFIGYFIFILFWQNVQSCPNSNTEYRAEMYVVRAIVFPNSSLSSILWIFFSLLVA